MKQSVGESITDEIHKHRYTHIPIYRSIHTCFHKNRIERYRLSFWLRTSSTRPGPELSPPLVESETLVGLLATVIVLCVLVLYDIFHEVQNAAIETLTHCMCKLVLRCFV